MDSKQKNNNSTAWIWAFTENGLNKAIGFVVYVILAQFLTPTEFGVVALARIVTDYMETIADQGLGNAIIQKKNLSNQLIDAAFWMNLFISLILFAFIFLFAPSIATFYDEPRLVDVLMILSVVIVISGLTRIQVAILIKNMRFRDLSYRSLTASLIGGVVGVFMAFNDYGVWSIVGQQVVSYTVSLMVLWKVSEWRPCFNISLEAVKELYSFSSKVILNQQLVFFSNKLDSIVVSTFFGLAALGIYDLAKKVILLMINVFYTPFSKILLSQYSKIQDNADEVSKQLISTLYLSGLIIIPIFIILSALSDSFILFLFGKEWVGAQSILSIVCIYGALRIFPTLLHASFLARGKPHYPLWSNLLRLIFLVSMIPFAIPFGLVGFGIILVISELFGILSDFIFLKNNLKVCLRSSTYTLMDLCISTLPIYILLKLLLEYVGSNHSDFVILFSGTVIGISAHATFLYVFKRDSLVTMKLLFYKK